MHRPGKSKFQMPEKKELTSFIEENLKSYNYEIHLHGRKQGLKAFAGVLAKVILKNYNSNDNSSVIIDDGNPIQEKIVV